MQEAYDIRNRTFSFGAHGYNQDEVDRYLRELADRIDAGDVDWGSEADRLARHSFTVVSLGYWRPDVDSYLVELRAWMDERAGERMMNGAESAHEPAAESADEPVAMPSGWAQGIVERLRRVTEASTSSTALADVAHAPVRDVVSAAPTRVEEALEEETVDSPADRMRLFRMAIALGVPDAVSMTTGELVAAIDARSDDDAASEAAGEPEAGEDAVAALERTKATLASFERMLADQVSQVTAAARHEREAAVRGAEEMMREAERRAEEILAAAERESAVVGDRAQRYSERVRRLADRDALRRVAAVEEPAPAPVAAEPEAEPEPVLEPEAAPEPEIEPEIVAAGETEPELDTGPETPADVEPQPQTASTWTRLRRIVRGEAPAQQGPADQ